MFVERFMAWAALACVGERADGVTTLAKRYIARDIAVDEIPDTEQVFTLFLDDPSPVVRSAMALALAPCDFLPRTLVWSLSRDIPEVAGHILKLSPLLGVQALVHAARDGDAVCQTAVAERDELDAKTVRTLVAFGAPLAVVALLENEGVLLSAELKHDLAKRLADDACVRRALLDDETIMPKTRQLLVHGLATSLVDFAVGAFDVDEGKLLSAANQAKSRGTLALASFAQTKEMQVYVEHLSETGQLNPTLMLRAVCEGQMHFFEVAMAHLSGLSLRRTRSMIKANRSSAYRALHTKAGLPAATLSVFDAALTTVRAGLVGHDLVMAIVDRVEAFGEADPALLALLYQMAAENRRLAARQYDRQLLLAA